MKPATVGVPALILLSIGCAKYRDFTLPEPRGEGDVVTFSWDVRPGPVLTRGAAGDWDGADALNPSVVSRDGLYFNFYSGYDGQAWHTGLATSPDGIRWTKAGQVLSPDPRTWEGGYIAANGSALDVDGEFFYWYQAGDPPRIGRASSRDGRLWRKEPRPVLDTGPRGSWDERGVADPYVIRMDGKFYMYFLGQDRARRQRLGVAVSENGLDWWKLRDNPILDLGPWGAFDETGLGEPAVWPDRGRYWMLYTARDRNEFRRLGLAVSPDGVTWERFSAEAVLEGKQPWNAKVVCDPTVELTPGGVRVWYGGGDVAHPAENLNGQIGLATFYLRGANLTE